MKFNKISKKLAAAVLTGAMIVSMLGMTAFAKTGAVEASENVSFKKVLDMTNAPGASVPSVTFTYSIAKGTAVAATDTTPEILAGEGTPTVGSAVYAPVDDPATDVNETALEKTVNVDFSGVTFTKPGIYRYVITENTTTSNADITDDENTTRYLDVYVVYNETTEKLEIAGQALLKEAVQPTTAGAYDSEKKSEGFTNSYKTYELTLDKVVKGTMGDRTKEFDFTIEFTGPKGASFTYGNEKITLDATTGKATVTGVKLTDSTEAIRITGIPSTVSYVITENIDSKEGYTTKYNITKDETTGADINATATGSQTIGTADNAVVCTNTKDAVTPTGVAMTVAPYILMVVLAAVFAFLFLRRRNRAEY